MTALAEKVYCLHCTRDAIATRLNVNYIETFSPYRAETHSVTVIKTSQLMLYREIIAVCSEIHTDTLCGQNVELLNVTEHKMCVLIFPTSFA